MDNRFFFSVLQGIAMYKQPKEDINVHDDHCYGQFLNIYFDHDHPGQLNSLVSSCITVKLDFLPYMLTHCEVPLPIPKMNNLTETVFLCGGSDNRVHMFLADKMRHTYVEVSFFLRK